MLRDYGRARGISLDALSFILHVIPDTAATQDEEVPVFMEKKLGKASRAFRVGRARPRGQVPSGFAFLAPSLGE